MKLSAFAPFGIEVVARLAQQPSCTWAASGAVEKCSRQLPKWPKILAEWGPMRPWGVHGGILGAVRSDLEGPSGAKRGQNGANMGQLEAKLGPTGGQDDPKRA